MRRAALAARATVVALALVACGGDDDTTSLQTDTSAPSSTTAGDDICSLLERREELYDQLHDEVSAGPLTRLVELPEGQALDEAGLAAHLTELDRIEAEVLAPLLDVYDQIVVVAEPQHRADLEALRAYDIGYLEHYRLMRTEDDILDIRPEPSVSDTTAALFRLEPLLEGDCGL